MDHHTTLLLTPTAPMQARIDSLFHLRTLGTPTAIHTICAAFHSTDSDLLLHELAYVLGQIGSTRALPHLYEVLHSKTKVYTPIVRHEAAEAIGAIGQMESIEILEKYADPATEPEKCVYETCQIAVELIKEAQKKGKRHGPTGGFHSIDPASPIEGNLSIKELQDIYLDSKQALYVRYKAMFALRNLNSEESVLALASGFQDESELFRHEIAYIFGQMRHHASIPSLIKQLSLLDESPMVRHEAAEALGSIATPEVRAVLEKFTTDPERVVRESCLVALDMADEQEEER